MSALNQLLASYSQAAAPGFPSLLDVTQTNATASGTNHSINMPASVSVGDLLVAVLSITTSTAITTPSGWTSIYSDTAAFATSAYYKVADGSEGGTTVNFVSAISSVISGQTHRVQASTYSGVPEASARATGSNVNPDPPTMTPSWGALNTLWMAVFAMSNNRTITGYPYAASQSATSVASPVIGSCYTSANASSLDPGTFTLNLNSGWIAIVIAIRPV